ncbi:hypothetical protein MTO96_008191 [Rhipicephalus appendiculatus]
MGRTMKTERAHERVLPVPIKRHIMRTFEIILCICTRGNTVLHFITLSPYSQIAPLSDSLSFSRVEPRWWKGGTPLLSTSEAEGEGDFLLSEKVSPSQLLPTRSKRSKFSPRFRRLLAAVALGRARTWLNEVVDLEGPAGTSVASCYRSWC